MCPKELMVMFLNYSLKRASSMSVLNAQFNEQVNLMYAEFLHLSDRFNWILFLIAEPYN